MLKTLRDPRHPLRRLRRRLGRRPKPSFATQPKELSIHPTVEIHNPERIHLGERVSLGPHSVLKAPTRYPRGSMCHPEGKHVEETFDPEIHLGSGVSATAVLRITALERIVVEDDVMFASNVFITDGSHGYSRMDLPYKYQGFEATAPVRIGRGSWIGQNVVIMPGVTVGEMCVIGANSVVTRSISDCSIAVGSPARVIKRWDDEAEGWVLVEQFRLSSKASELI